MSDPRVRIIGFTVNIDAVVDDGENLTALTVQPVRYAAADAALFNLDHVRDALQRQVDATGLPADTPTTT
jgi:hypothetical protein